MGNVPMMSADAFGLRSPLPWCQAGPPPKRAVKTGWFGVTERKRYFGDRKTPLQKKSFRVRLAVFVQKLAERDIVLSETAPQCADGHAHPLCNGKFAGSPVEEAVINRIAHLLADSRFRDQAPDRSRCEVFQQSAQFGCPASQSLVEHLRPEEHCVLCAVKRDGASKK